MACGVAQEGGVEAQKRLEFWWDCLQDGTIPHDQHPVGWPFKTAGLPQAPTWAKGAGVGVKPPEAGFGPGAPCHVLLTVSRVNHRADTLSWLLRCRSAAADALYAKPWRQWRRRRPGRPDAADGCAFNLIFGSFRLVFGTFELIFCLFWAHIWMHLAAEADRAAERREMLQFQQQMMAAVTGQRFGATLHATGAPMSGIQQQQQTTTTTTTSGPGQRPLTSFFTPDRGGAAGGAAAGGGAAGIGADIAAALQDPAVMAAIAAAMAR